MGLHAGQDSCQAAGQRRTLLLASLLDGGQAPPGRRTRCRCLHPARAPPAAAGPTAAQARRRAYCGRGCGNRRSRVCWCAGAEGRQAARPRPGRGPARPQPPQPALTAARRWWRHARCSVARPDTQTEGGGWRREESDAGRRAGGWVGEGCEGSGRTAQLPPCSAAARRSADPGARLPPAASRAACPAAFPPPFTCLWGVGEVCSVDGAQHPLYLWALHHAQLRGAGCDGEGGGRALGRCRLEDAGLRGGAAAAAQGHTAWRRWQRLGQLHPHTSFRLSTSPACEGAGWEQGGMERASGKLQGVAAWRMRAPRRRCCHRPGSNPPARPQTSCRPSAFA